MNIVLFEDEKYRDLLPLVYFRPVWELRCGIQTLAEKIFHLFSNHKISFLSRKYLQDYYLSEDKIFAQDKNEEYLFINGRVLLKATDKKLLLDLDAELAIVSSGDLVAFKITGNKFNDLIDHDLPDSQKILGKFKSVEAGIDLINYPWDLIDRNGAEIARDFINLGGNNNGDSKIHAGAHLLNPENIYVGKAIGKSSLVKIGAKIYENTSVGPVCKVGGEVEETIIQEYSNKQHDGFLGHSYLGAWINIGADTNNSDLKNNYGEISVYLNDRNVETGKRFLGLIMGDHSKTAINTMFNTGTVVGVSSNIFGAGFPPKFIPSFAWGGSDGIREYNFDKAIEVAEIVMNRRKVPFTSKTKQLFQSVKDLSFKVENRVRVR
ncbi:MAG: putative sugar nucleotidyl transferase [Calditrichia bacterium]